MHIVVVRHRDETRRIACPHEQVVRDRRAQRRHAPAAQIDQTVNAGCLLRSHGEHFTEFEVGEGGGVPGAACGRVLDTREAEREITPFDGLIDAGPLDLDEAGGATESAGDPVGDLDVEATYL